jgi:hypothetical protein
MHLYLMAVINAEPLRVRDAEPLRDRKSPASPDGPEPGICEHAAAYQRVRHVNNAKARRTFCNTQGCLWSAAGNQRTYTPGDFAALSPDDRGVQKKITCVHTGLRSSPRTRRAAANRSGLRNIEILRAVGNWSEQRGRVSDSKQGGMDGQGKRGVDKVD